MGGLLRACVPITVALTATGCPEVHRLSVERVFSTTEEESLIYAAEAVCPIDRAAAPSAIANTIDKGVECFWDHGSFDGIAIPYSLTSDAIAYYSGLVMQWDAAERPREDIWRTRPFEYLATIDFHDEFVLGDETFNEVYVVNISASWSAICGRLCGQFWDKERVVVITAEGEVLAIDGDGPTDLAVS